MLFCRCCAQLYPDGSDPVSIVLFCAESSCCCVLRLIACLLRFSKCSQILQQKLEGQATGRFKGLSCQWPTNSVQENELILKKGG